MSSQPSIFSRCGEIRILDFTICLSHPGLLRESRQAGASPADTGVSRFARLDPPHPEIRVLAGVVCSETLFLAGAQLSYRILTWQREREIISLGVLLRRALTPFVGLCPLDLSTSQTPDLLI